MHKRLITIIIIFTIFFLGITGKTFYEQVIMGPTYANKSLEIRTKQIPAEEYIRGDILDRNGISLTDTAYRPTIVVFPQLIKDAQKFIEKVNKYLPELKISLKDIQSYHRSVNKVYPDPFIIHLEANSNYGEIIRSWNEPGVTVLPIKTRYGDNSLAVHIVGYVGYSKKDDGLKGRKGIEFWYDNELKGSRIEKIVTPITDARDNMLMGLGYRIIDLGEDPKRNDVILTIDSRIQRIVEEVMDEKGISKGGVLVLDIDTGAILAAASRPNFDQNNLNETNSFDNNQIERTISYKVDPGSIFKVITAAAALEEGIVTPKTKFFCTGSSSYVNCPRKHGEVTFAEAMEHSCNVTFVEVGQELGREKLEEYIIRKFGFKTVPNKYLNSPRARANGIIGQEIFMVSPLEIANMMATIARDGYHQELPEKKEDRLQARLVKGIKNGNKMVSFSEIPQYHKLYSKQTAQYLKAMLTTTNQMGSGKRAWVEGFGSAGKTGTPQVGPNKYMAWYTGYAPLDKPKLAVAVLVEEIDHLDKADLQGGRHAAPVFREIVERSLKLGM